MPRNARTLAATVPALVVVAAAWLRLEHPVGSLSRAAALGALALAAAALPRRRWRAVGAAGAAVAGAWLAMGVSIAPSHPVDPGSAFGLQAPVSEFGRRFGNGFADFYGTHLPFDPRVHVAMGELVLVAILAFSLLVALLAAARKPLAGSLALLVGAGWPSTLLGPSHGVAFGAAILAAVLLLLAGLGSRRLPALALPAAAVVAAAAVAVGSATAAGGGLVDWQSWNPAHIAGGPVGVGFVWDAQYSGLDWPARPTVVLQVQSVSEPSYLRAGVLDDFVGDAWSMGAPRTADGLEPAAALQPRNQTPETVTIESLADTRLVGGSVPIRYAAGYAPLDEPERGFAVLPSGLPNGFRYTVWSYTARPTEAELSRSPPEYPSVLANDGLLDVGRGVRLPPFGAPGRPAAVETLLTRNPSLNSYVPLARVANEVSGGARTPYGAVARLERWFLVGGGFHYSNHPLVVGPPLVGFVTKTRAGYCQFFAGAMALMLRYLGIPARVAVGFAGATRAAPGDWVVTDRAAHVWVEAWFKGYGWLPFDPTPAVPESSNRPVEAAGAVAAGVGGSSQSLPAPHGKRATGRGSATVADVLSRKNGLSRPHGPVSDTTAGGGLDGGGGYGRSAFLLLLLLVLAAGGGAIVLTKGGFRLIRSFRRDPRQVAAACREELACFLLDQGTEVSPSATLTELGHLLRHEFGVNARPFVAAATAARFGRRDLATGAAHDARRELRALVAALRRCLTWRERLRGLLSLRSLSRPSAARYFGSVPGSASLGSGIMGSTGS